MQAFCQNANIELKANLSGEYFLQENITSVNQQPFSTKQAKQDIST